MKHAALCLILFCAPALVAQEKPRLERGPEQPAGAQEYTRATPAPQLGHPLDPADVDVLTGKMKAPASASYRLDPLSYVSGSYAGYPDNVAPWRAPRFAGFGPARRPFVPLLGGRTRGGWFFSLGNSPVFALPFSLRVRGRWGTRDSFLFPPARSGIFLRR
jgi:hypothetical protein